MNYRPLALISFLVLGSAVWSEPGVAAPFPQAALYGKDDDSSADKKDSTKPPFKGMTKAQATHFYGEPDSVGHRDGEELWTYVLNRGETISKSFIPFNFNNKIRYRLLTFKDGKVVDFRWDPPDKE
jgi:hypothetical protein